MYPLRLSQTWMSSLTTLSQKSNISRPPATDALNSVMRHIDNSVFASVLQWVINSSLLELLNVTHSCHKWGRRQRVSVRRWTRPFRCPQETLESTTGHSLGPEFAGCPCAKTQLQNDCQSISKDVWNVNKKSLLLNKAMMANECLFQDWN